MRRHAFTLTEHPGNAKISAGGNEPFRRRRHKGDDMNCERFQEYLFEYMDDSLPLSERAVAEQHLAGCSACREAAQQESQLTQSLSRWLEQAIEPVALNTAAKRRMATRLFREYHFGQPR